VKQTPGWKEAFASSLAKRESAGLLRELDVVFSKGLESREGLINLASNDYLGLAFDERVLGAAIEAIRNYGTGATASRLVTGNLEIHEQLEDEIARWLRTEQAVLFPTGYSTNVGVVSAIAKLAGSIYSDALNHASLVDGIRLAKVPYFVYRHRDCNHLQELLEQNRMLAPPVIVTDGVFSMDGDIAPIRDLYQLAERFDALLIVDDAHGHGVVGPEGRGVIAEAGLSSELIVEIGTLSKALGSQGGFVACSKPVARYLINSARSFIYSTGLAPAAAAAARAAIEIARTDEGRRLRLTRYCLSLASAIGEPKPSAAIIPVITGSVDSALSLSRALKDHGLYAPAIRPPTVPEGTSRVRLAVSAHLGPDEVDYCASVLNHLMVKYR
jgi:8-amino-7-oxononanoate synthase